MTQRLAFDIYTNRQLLVAFGYTFYFSTYHRRLRNYSTSAGLSELTVHQQTKPTPKRSRAQPQKKTLAYGGVIHASIRNRWQSDRPFVGHSEGSMLRKLQSNAVLEYTKNLIREEFFARGFTKIDTLTGKLERSHRIKIPSS